MAAPGASAAPIHVLDSSHGLASNQIHRMARDPSGRIWLATPVGLARYDGSFIDAFDRRTGLQCNGLRSVSVGSDGTVWVGTDQGIERVDGEGRPLPGAIHGWHHGLCQHADASGPHPWLGTAQGLVQLDRALDGPGLRVRFTADVGFVNDIAHLGPDRVLAASAGHGLVETDGRTWWTYRCAGSVGRRVTRIAVGIRGDLVIGTAGGAFVVDAADGRLRSLLRIEHEDPMVSAIAVAPDRYWVAFGRHLLGFDPDAMHLPAERYHADSPINDLHLDTFGNLWLATNNSGLAMVSCLRRAVNRIDLGRKGSVFSIRADGGDRYAIGGENLFGDCVLGPEAGEAALSAPDGLPLTTVWDSCRDARGTWVATAAGLFHAPHGAALAPVHVQHELLGAPARVVLSRDGEPWVGTLRGLVRIDDGVPRSVDGDGSALGYVYAMTLDERGALWVATLGRGLWREHDGLRRVVGGPLAPDGNTYAVAKGPRGALLVLQDEKIVLIEPDAPPRLVGQLPPVAGWCAAWLSDDSVAIGASDGLRVLDLASGRVTRHLCAMLPPREWEFTNNRSLVREGDARLLCGLNAGLVRVDLDRLKAFLAPPECKRSAVAWNGVEPVRTTTGYLLRARRWSVRVRAFAAWFVDNASLRFQFQLVGFDEDWSPLDSRPEVVYTSLPAGSYRLKVRAHSPLTGFGPESELLRLTVGSPWWARGWGPAFAALDSIYRDVAQARNRNRFLLQRNRELEAAVVERTESLRLANRETEAMRDAYRQLSEVDELTQLGNRRTFDRELARAIALSRRLSAPLALLLIDVDHFKAVNDRYGHPGGDEYLRLIARAIRASIRVGEDCAARYGGEEFAIVLVSTPAEGAEALAERIRSAVAALALPNIGAPGGSVTISVGIAVSTVSSPLDQQALVERADLALYRAKQGGRDRVVIADRGGTAEAG